MLAVAIFPVVESFQLASNTVALKEASKHCPHFVFFFFLSFCFSHGSRVGPRIVDSLPLTSPDLLHLIFFLCTFISERFSSDC